MNSRKLKTIINSVRELQEGYFDPKKGSNQEFEGKIKSLKNHSQK
jgi:hypothetical protein